MFNLSDNLFQLNTPISVELDRRTLVAVFVFRHVFTIVRLDYIIDLTYSFFFLPCSRISLLFPLATVKKTK